MILNWFYTWYVSNIQRLTRRFSYSIFSFSFGLVPFVMITIVILVTLKFKSTSFLVWWDPWMGIWFLILFYSSLWASLIIARVETTPNLVFAFDFCIVWILILFLLFDFSSSQSVNTLSSQRFWGGLKTPKNPKKFLPCLHN